MNIRYVNYYINDKGSYLNCDKHIITANRFVEFDKNFNTIKTIANSLSKGDIIENYIYEYNVYDIRDTQAYFQCVFPSYVLTKTLNPNKLPIDKFNSYFSFPLDLNKTSIKHINYSKNIIIIIII